MKLEAEKNIEAGVVAPHAGALVETGRDYRKMSGAGRASRRRVS